MKNAYKITLLDGITVECEGPTDAVRLLQALKAASISVNGQSMPPVPGKKRISELGIRILTELINAGDQGITSEQLMERLKIDDGRAMGPVLGQIRQFCLKNQDRLPKFDEAFISKRNRHGRFWRVTDRAADVLKMASGA